MVVEVALVSVCAAVVTVVLAVVRVVVHSVCGDRRVSSTCVSTVVVLVVRVVVAVVRDNNWREGVTVVFDNSSLWRVSVSVTVVLADVSDNGVACANSIVVSSVE